jgi:hypothetical protein
MEPVSPNDIARPCFDAGVALAESRRIGTPGAAGVVASEVTSNYVACISPTK